MVELNLLPDVKKEFIHAQRTRNSVISMAILATIAAGAIIVLLAVTVYVLQGATIALQTKSIEDKAKTLKAKPEINKYLTVQNQLQNIDTLHSTKPIYSRIFSYIQSLNPAAPNNVALGDMTVTADGTTVEIAGTAADFHALSVFKTTLESATLEYTSEGSSDKSEMKLFNAVNLRQASVSNVNGRSLMSFRFSLVYPSEIFLGSVKNAVVKVPAEVTSDADKNAPRPVFGDQSGEMQ